jgi:hypothetical protein
LPKELSNTVYADSFAAQAEQSNEHSEKQCNVSDEEDDDVKFAAVGVEDDAFHQSDVPIGAELQIDKPRRSKNRGLLIHPRNACSDICVYMPFLMFFKERETTCLGRRPQHWSPMHYLRLSQQSYSNPIWRRWEPLLALDLGQTVLDSKYRGTLTYE